MVAPNAWKAAFLGVALSIVCLGTASAHDHSFSLDGGRVVLGYVPGGTGGFGTITSFYMIGDELQRAVINLTCGHLSETWSGDVASLEYGVTDVFSVGVKTNLTQMLVYGLREGYWAPKASGFTGVDLGRALNLPPALGLFWNEEVQFDPLMTSDVYSENELVNVFSSVSTNWRVVETPDFSLAAYLDGKVITTFANPYLKAPWMDLANYLETMRNEGVSVASDATAEFQSAHHLAAALGLEGRVLGHWIASLGVAVPVGMIFTDYRGSAVYSWDFGGSWQTYLMSVEAEFQLKYQF